MGNMIIDLQLACENTEGLPSEAQILQWATAQFNQKVIMLK
mgnify:CR=1 FL=1